MSNSRISGLHHLGIAARLKMLAQSGWLAPAEVELLQQGKQVLRPSAADRMVENVVGVFGLPLAIAPNFVVNGRDAIVPMVTEEPSVVAALSNAARMARPAGFVTHCDEWLLAGQIHVTAIVDAEAAMARLHANHAALLDQANAVHPRLAEYGGGVRDLECRVLELGSEQALAVHVLVDTGNAMGANIVNTICESIAPAIAQICDGRIALRILSNLADRSLVTARVNYEVAALASGHLTGEEVRDQIVVASDIALADPYRAATHNKGIMNGVDAVAIATGNDWRAIEAGAHAYAAASGRYQPLSAWKVAANGSLQGELRMPLRVATVGGTLRANPATALALRLIAAESSRQLAELMAAVGLAQNFAAIRALATDGIQKGHMRMHARSTKTRQSATPQLHPDPHGSAAGKVILVGEHAAVYGKHVLALPIPSAVTARIVEQGGDESRFVNRLLHFIKQQLAIDDDGLGAEIRSTLLPGMGLGVSAAMAVAVIRAINHVRELGMDDDAINRLAFACEKTAHGNPSGIDNTIATFAKPVLFSNAAEPAFQVLDLNALPPLLIAYSTQRGSTREQVAAVHTRYVAQAQHYDALFDSIDAMSLAAVDALRSTNYEVLGSLMNTAHGVLNAIGVSTPELEGMVAIARAAGATGAKLTGSGGGGSIVALCPGMMDEVAAALQAAGYDTLALHLQKRISG